MIPTVLTIAALAWGSSVGEVSGDIREGENYIAEAAYTGLHLFKNAVEQANNRRTRRRQPRTHCKRNHELTSENLGGSLDGSGYYACADGVVKFVNRLLNPGHSRGSSKSLPLRR